jgi:hypothetical protein
MNDTVARPRHPSGTHAAGITIEQPARAATRVKAVMSETKRIALIVLAIYHLLGLFAFRNVLLRVPDIWAGTHVINGDELVPFFNWNSQLLDQAAGKFNEITHGFEFRVRYAFLTTWFRYFKILPLAIVFVIPQIVYWSYAVAAWLISRILPQFNARTIYIVTAGPILAIYTVMIYAKITHFYTLILGFSLYFVGAMCMLYGLAFEQKNPYKPIAVSCIITVFNPAVHYLVLSGLYFAMAVGTLLVIELVGAVGKGWWRYLFRIKTWPSGVRYVIANRKRLLVSNRFWRCVGASGMFVVVTLIPYALMVKLIFLRGVPNLSETVPADYYFIKDASISLDHVLAFDMAGIMDKELTGDYLAKEPRVPNFVYAAMLFVPLLVKRARSEIFHTESMRRFGTVVYLCTIFSIWATLGYSGAEGGPTFHRTIAAISNFANGTQSTAGDLVVKLMSTITQVLRFPHRFQLIMLMMSLILLPISALWLQSWVAEKWSAYRERKQRTGESLLHKHMAVTMAVLCLVPMWSIPEYRTVLASGDMHHFLRPYPLGPLTEVKRVLQGLPRGKTVVFPPTETAKAVLDIEGYEHKFIDKFHAYYLDLPSYYYGLTGDSNNKHNFFLLLRAMYYEQPWWINIARNLNLKYIVVNKELVANGVGGQEYLREVERIIIPEIDRRSDYLKKLFENESYVIYEFTDLPTARRVPLFISTDWPTYIRILTRNLQLTRYYELRHTMMLGDLEKFDQLTVVTNDLHDTMLDLYAKSKAERYFKPTTTIMAFNPYLISSAYYLSPMFRLFQFFSDSKWNRLNTITPGLWGSLNGGFIGVPKPTQVRIDMNLKEGGTYRLMMRGAVSLNEIEMSSKSLPASQWLTLRSDPAHLAIYDKATVFTKDRVPLDLDAYSPSDLGRLIPGDAVAINSQFDWFDLGTYAFDAGKHTIYLDKTDSNPLLFEGVLAIPDDEYLNLKLPDNVRVVTAAELCCRSFVRDGQTP